MSTESERVYTIPLGKVLLSPNNRRAMRAINVIREFARHHMKAEDIRIEENVSHEIWERGIKKPPRKIRVRMVKTDDGHILVSPYALAVKTDEKEKGKDAKSKSEEKTTKSDAPKSVADDAPEPVTTDVAPKTPSPKTPEPSKAAPKEPKPTSAPKPAQNNTTKKPKPESKPAPKKASKENSK